MRNLLRADLYRVLRNKLLYVGLILCILAYWIGVTDKFVAGDFDAASFVAGIQASLESIGVSFLCVLPIFLVVFSQELSARSMQCVLGHGLTRGKLIVTKLLEAAILMAGYFVVLALSSVALLQDDSMFASSRQISLVLLQVGLAAIRFYGYLVFSAMVLYITNSTAAGIIACVAFSLMFRGILMMLDRVFPMRFFDYTFDGLLSRTYSVFAAGGIGWQVFPALLYLIAALVVTIVFFRRKEFEF